MTSQDLDRFLNQYSPAELFFIALLFDSKEALDKKIQLLKENPDVLKTLLSSLSDTLPHTIP